MVPEARRGFIKSSKFTLHDYLKCAAFFNLRPILCSHDSHEHEDEARAARRRAETSNGRDTIFITMFLADITTMKDHDYDQDAIADEFTGHFFHLESEDCLQDCQNNKS